MSSLQLSGSSRIKINRTVLTKDNNAVVRRRRSFGLNVNHAAVRPTQANLAACERNSGQDAPWPEVNSVITGASVLLGPATYSQVASPCVVKIEALLPQHLEVSLADAGGGGEEEAAAGKATFKPEAKGKEDPHQHCALSVRQHSGKKHTRRLIKSACCVTCCDDKSTHSKCDGLAIRRPSETQAKETTKNPTSKKLDRKTEKHPVVKLCNVANIFSSSTSFLHSRCTLPEELKRKSIHCFKRDCGERIFLEFSSGPWMKKRISQSQKASPGKKNITAFSVVQRCTDIKCAPSVGTCDKRRHVDADGNASEYQMAKKLRASNENGSRLCQANASLAPDFKVSVVQSATISSSCEPGPLHTPGPPSLAEVRRLSLDVESEPQDSDCKDGVEESRGIKAGSVAMTQTNSDHAKGCLGDASLEGKDTPDGADMESCRRTTPYITAPSCARTYISWPFQKVKRSEKRPAGNSSPADVQLSITHTGSENTSVMNAPAKPSVLHSAKTETSVPAEGPGCNGEACSDTKMFLEVKAGLQREDAESIKFDAKPVDPVPSIISAHSEPECQVSSRMLSHHLGFLGDPGQQSGVCGSKEGLGLPFWEKSGMQKERLQNFRIPLKMCSSTVNAERNQSCLHQQVHSVVAPLKATVGAKGLLPSPRRQASMSSKLRAEPFTSTQIGAHLPNDDYSGDDSSLNSEDEAEDFVHLLESDIMCEIQDSSTGPPQEHAYPRSSAKVEGALEDAMDVVKAYEQDAIILDVIQDDPDLFGTISTEITFASCKKTGRPQRSEHGDVGKSVKSHPKIVWDSQVSFRGSTDPAQTCKDKGSLTLHLNAENKSGMVLSDGRPSESTAGEECYQTTLALKEQSMAGHPNDGLAEWFWGDFVPIFQYESNLSADNSGHQAVNSGDSGGSSGKCEERETPHKSQGVPTAAAPVKSSGPLDRDVYCKYYFSTKHVCFRKVCWFLHVPADGDEKFCIEVVNQFSRGANQSLLQRAAAVFVSYYQKCPPGIHFDVQTLKFLLAALFKHGIIKDILAVLRVTTTHRILPPPEFVLLLFDHVSQCGLHVAAADLIDATSMCVDAGLPFTVEHFKRMQHCLELLGLPVQQMNGFLAIKYRALLKTDAWKGDMEVSVTVSEVELCKEQEDWAMLGHLFSGSCAPQRSLAELHQLCSRVTLALLTESTEALLPFAQFAQAVCQDNSTNGLLTNLLGQIGVSLMFQYYGAKQWKKGRQLLDTLKDLNINYSMFEGPFGNESGVSRCRVVSMAAEVFLNSGSMEEALQTLKDNDWITGSSLWPCDSDDLQKRRAVLLQLAESFMQKGIPRVALQVLTDLPGLQLHLDSADVSSYNEIFNRHLKSCIEKHSLMVASDTINFMFAKNIAVEVHLLRTLVHKLGKQNIWLKARSLYKCGMSMGCYPQAQINQYCRLLSIATSLTEIEMAIAFEMFMVSNSSEIEGPSQIPLQVVLKRKGTLDSASDNDYNAAGSRLLCAAQIVNPKLVVKYATVNPSLEQVFTLEPLSMCKWLAQNREWANEIWSVPSGDLGTNDCLDC